MSKRAVAGIVKIMDDAGLTEFTTETTMLFGLIKRRIHLSKQQFAAAPAVSAPVVAVPAQTAGVSAGAITSPMVGVVYLSPEPTEKPFVSKGQKVNAGDTLALVEAMKTFNPIKADKAGEVAEILVKDGDTVEFGTPIIVIK